MKCVVFHMKLVADRMTCVVFRMKLVADRMKLVAFHMKFVADHVRSAANLVRRVLICNKMSQILNDAGLKYATYVSPGKSGVTIHKTFTAKRKEHRAKVGI